MLNEEIRTSEFVLLDRMVEESRLRRRIGFLKHGRKDYNKELRELRDYKYTTAVIRIELEFKKRRL